MDDLAQNRNVGGSDHLGATLRTVAVAHDPFATCCGGGAEGGVRTTFGANGAIDLGEL